MIRKYIIFILILISILILENTPGYRAEEKEIVAVLNLTGLTGVPVSDAEMITVLLQGEILNTGKYTIVEREKVSKAIMQEQMFQQTGCTESACAVKMGRILNAKKIITGSIGKLGNDYMIALTMFDVEKGILEKSEKVRCASMGVIEKCLVEIAAKITDTAIKETPSYVPSTAGEIKGEGTLTIKTTPSGAKVMLNGDEKGESPLKLKLVQGTYGIAIIKEGYMDSNQNIEIKKDEETKLDISLVKETGKMTIKTNPEGCKVSVNGEYKGETKGEGLRLTGLDTGKYRIKIEKEKYEAWEQEIEIRTGDDKTIKADLIAQKGGVFVSSSPKEGEIYINSQYYEKTPKKIQGLKEGTYKITIKKDGYEDWNSEIQIKAGEVGTISTLLKAIPVVVATPTPKRTPTVIATPSPISRSTPTPNPQSLTSKW